MNDAQIQHIIDEKSFPYLTQSVDLIETHISWLLLGDRYVYKIKKPVKLSFLDFSTLELRKFFCEQELKLNRRFSTDMYLDVLPIRKEQDAVFIGGAEGQLIDYALLMRKMDLNRQLDVLIQNNDVESGDMEQLADEIANFHHRTEVIPEGENWHALYEEFADLQTMVPAIQQYFDSNQAEMVRSAISWCYSFLSGIQWRIKTRNQLGLVVDGHGDLHTRNIFMLSKPVLFDCIEFNDDFRKLDVLSEIAFLCVDLDRFGRQDLAMEVSTTYFQRFPAIRHPADSILFLFYKLYRANVMIKVHMIRWSELHRKGISNNLEKQLIKKYLSLFRIYFHRISMK